MTVDVYGLVVKGGLDWILTAYGMVAIFVSLTLAFIYVVTFEGGENHECSDN